MANENVDPNLAPINGKTIKFKYYLPFYE
jgi:hypothetical protein